MSDRLRLVSTRTERHHDMWVEMQRRKAADPDRLGGAYTPEEIEAGHRQLRAEYRPDPAAEILASVEDIA